MRGKKGTRSANGEGHIWQLPDGKYRMHKQHGYKDNGNPKVLTVTGRSRSECIKKMKKKEEEYDSKRCILENIQRMSLSDMCSAHLDHDKKHKAGLKDTSIDRRASSIKNQIRGKPIGQRQVASITSEDIIDYVSNLLNTENWSVSTVQKAYQIVNAAYKWAQKRNLIDYNPCEINHDQIISQFKDLKKRSVDDIRVKSLSGSQIKVLAMMCSLKNNNNGKIKYTSSIVIMFLLNTGLRVGELCCLRWKDVIKRSNIVLLKINKTRHVVSEDDGLRKSRINESNTKNCKARVIELSERAIYYLDILDSFNPGHDDDDYVVLNRVRKPTEPSRLIDRINTVYRNAEMPKDVSGAHILRKTFATERFKEGWTVEMIAAYIGDESATVWKHYINETAVLDCGDGCMIKYIQYK